MGTLKEIDYGIGKYLTASDASAIPGIGNNRKNLDLLNFKIASNNAYTLYKFKDGFIDAYQDQTGVNIAGSSVIYDSTDKYYSPPDGSTGGTITTLGDYTVHSFTSTGNTNFVVLDAGNVDTLVVAGGGGGGGEGGGGGGAGGMRTATSQAVTAQTYVVTVGAGGAGNAGSNFATQGGNSVFSTITSAGGAKGTYPAANGQDGGSGSGAGYGGNAGGGNTPSTSPSQGASGGAGGPYGGGPANSHSGGGGGGGGASGTAGANGTNSAGSGNGGNGTQNDFRTGSNVYYSGGGGGGTIHPFYSGSGGLGGGGAAGTNAPGGGPGFDGTDGLGGGGGSASGTGSTLLGGTGGDGIVVVRYTSGSLGRGDMTLLSNTQTANAQPDLGRLMVYEEDVDTITLDADLKGWVSRDGGTTYTQTPLVLDANITHPTSLLLHCDGANDGVVFTDSSFWAHPIAVVGSTHTDTAVKKFGTASAQFDGTGDGLTIPDSSAWDFNTDPFAIDLWVYGSSSQTSGSYKGIVSTGGASWATGEWTLTMNTSNGFLEWWRNDGSGVLMITSTTNFKDNAWHHVAVTKQGNDSKMFVDGTQEGSTYATGYSLVAPSTGLIIGDNGYSADRNYTGYIDEVRITKGQSRWTSNFTPPSAAYTGTEGDTRLLSGSVDISGQPAGSDMKYKVETLNNKNLKLHGASLLWA